MRSSGGLLITVTLVFLSIFSLELPGSLKALAAVALALNIRWWWFMVRQRGTRTHQQMR
jgi:uncharacterized membrane protein YiaA